MSNYTAQGLEQIGDKIIIKCIGQNIVEVGNIIGCDTHSSIPKFGKFGIYYRDNDMNSRWVSYKSLEYDIEIPQYLLNLPVHKDPFEYTIIDILE